MLKLLSISARKKGCELDQRRRLYGPWPTGPLYMRTILWELIHHYVKLEVMRFSFICRAGQLSASMSCGQAVSSILAATRWKHLLCLFDTGQVARSETRILVLFYAACATESHAQKSLATILRFEHHSAFMSQAPDM